MDTLYRHWSCNWHRVPVGTIRRHRGQWSRKPTFPGQGFCFSRNSNTEQIRRKRYHGRWRKCTREKWINGISKTEKERVIINSLRVGKLFFFFFFILPGFRHIIFFAVVELSKVDVVTMSDFARGNPLRLLFDLPARGRQRSAIPLGFSSPEPDQRGLWRSFPFLVSELGNLYLR